MTDNTNLPKQPGAWSQELPYDSPSLKGNTDNSRQLFAPKPMQVGEVKEPPVMVEPQPIRHNTDTLSPFERRARLEAVAVPIIQRLTREYQLACDRLEAFDADTDAHSARLANDYVFTRHQHSKVRVHTCPGDYYLNHGLEHETFTAPPAGQADIYHVLSIKRPTPNGTIYVTCVPEGVRSLHQLASDKETCLYVKTEIKRGRKRLVSLRDASLQNLTDYKQQVRQLLDEIPTLEVWLS